jgi:hypothetical protein
LLICSFEPKLNMTVKNDIFSQTPSHSIHPMNNPQAQFVILIVGETGGGEVGGDRGEETAMVQRKTGKTVLPDQTTIKRSGSDDLFPGVVRWWRICWSKGWAGLSPIVML